MLLNVVFCWLINRPSSHVWKDVLRVFLFSNARYKRLKLSIYY